MSTEVTGESWEQPSFQGDIPAPSNEVVEASAAYHADVAIRSLFVPDGAVPLFWPNMLAMRRNKEWDIKEGIGIYEVGLGIRDNVAHKTGVKMRERTNVFITADPAVLEKSAEVLRLMSEAEGKFFSREVGKSALGISVMLPEAGIGVAIAAAASGGNRLAEALGVIAGGSLGIRFALTALNKVSKRIEKPVRKAEAELFKTVSQSSLTCALPNYGPFTRYMGSDVAELLRLSDNRQKELATLLPVVGRIVQDELRAQEIAPRIQELTTRVNSLKKETGIIIETENEELKKLQAIYAETSNSAATGRKHINDRIEHREKEIKFNEAQKTYSDTFRKLIKKQALINPTVSPNLQAIVAALNKAHDIENTDTIGKIVSDLQTILDTVTTEKDSSRKSLMVKDAYNAIVKKYEKMITLPLFEDIEQ
jgi:hypothetical protein